MEPCRTSNNIRSQRNEHSTAHHLCIENHRFRVTHPFHPLHGREFELIEITSMLGVGLVHYTVDDGTLGTIRQAHTSAASVDPFTRVAAGRSAFRVSDLLALAALLDSLDGDGRAGREAEVGAGTVKEILPHV